MNGTQPEATPRKKSDDALLKALEDLKEASKNQKHTGKGILEVDFFHGGVVGIRSGLIDWIK